MAFWKTKKGQWGMLTAGSAILGLLVGATLLNPPTAHVQAEGNGEQVQQAHLTTAHGWSNDLQTIVWNDAGYYDVYFLHSEDGATNPFGSSGQDWVHTTTSDFLHYGEQNSAIPASGGDDTQGWQSAWTGSIVTNTGNIPNVPVGAKVAYFTGIRKSDKTQNIYASYSQDNGRTFTQPLNDGKPVADVSNANNKTDFRDPAVYYWQNKMLMYVAEGSEIGVYQSTDGVTWSLADPSGGSKILASTFFYGHSWDGNAPVECPVIKTMQTPSGESKQVLIFGAKDASVGETTGTYYEVGHLDANGLFVTETTAKRLDQGSDFYGANTNGSDTIDTVNHSLIALGWVGNWNYFTTGVHTDQNASSEFVHRLGSYSSAREVQLTDGLTLTSSLMIPKAATRDSVTYSNVTKDAPKSQSGQQWVDREDTNGHVYGLYDIPNQSAAQYYQLTFSSSQASYKGRIYIDIWQGEDYVRFNYDPSNGKYNVKAYAAELNNGTNGQVSSDYYRNGLLGNGNGYLADSGLSGQQSITLTVVTDTNSVEFAFPNGQIYTVSRFNTSGVQDFKIFTEDPDNANQVTITQANLQ
ncbi:glycoside hydrolase family 32 protein [Streptococcus sp. DD12]|uniref:glycoside hydrolase family 32 protein n=1 Tax=Streptococcus sp. DD12 TaxID=1777880 RepID=UPI000793F534|nr:glycoside hydrolase family 32 protein [Streptococcus sp. DD12]KXT76975.1 hypothetical protein STRDD12_00109 [Streptococcus sp. DD12]